MMDEAERARKIADMRARNSKLSAGEAMARIRYAVDRICLGCGEEVEPNATCKCGEFNACPAR